MPIPISPRTEHLLGLLFTSDVAAIVRIRLITDVGDNIPHCEEASAEDMERIRFAIIKLTHQNYSYLNNAIQRCKIDWRDLLVIAQFVEREAHLRWFEEVNFAANAG